MRIGQIGLKGHQGVVLHGAEKLGGCQLVAISEDDSAVAEKLVKNSPLARQAETYRDWRHLIEHTMMDICVVCDTNNVRADQIVALAERNIHIIAEKPLATTLADLERIRAALAKSKSRLTMLLTMRHEPKYAAVRKLVQSGAIGRVCQVSAQKSYRVGERPAWMKRRETLGGTIPYIGIHSLDMMRWTTGLDYTHVAAFHANLGTPYFGETEDTATVLARMIDGVVATARLDYLRPAAAPTHGDDRLRIAGSDGVIEIREDFKDLQLITKDAAPREIVAEPVEDFFASFVRSIREDRPQVISADDSLRITEVVLKARDAADRMAMVEL